MAQTKMCLHIQIVSLKFLSANNGYVLMTLHALEKPSRVGVWKYNSQVIKYFFWKVHVKCLIWKILIKFPLYSSIDFKANANKLNYVLSRMPKIVYAEYDIDDEKEESKNQKSV